MNKDHRESNSIDRAAFEEYYKKEQSKMIYIHKVVISLLIIFIIIILSFFLVFDSQIDTINQSNTSLSSAIVTKEVSNKNKTSILNRKLVSLYTSKAVFHREFLQIIKNQGEYDRIMNWVGSTYNEVILCYSNSIHSGFVYDDPFDYCQYYTTLIFIIQTQSGHRLGGVLHNFHYGKHVTEDNQAFLFNFDTNKIFTINNYLNAYVFNQETNRLVFGSNALVVNFDFRTKQSEAKFPTNEYGDSGSTLSDLTGGEAVFSIAAIEILGRREEYSDN